MTSEPDPDYETDIAKHEFVPSDADPALCNEYGEAENWHKQEADGASGDAEQNGDGDAEAAAETVAVAAYDPEHREMRTVYDWGLLMARSGFFKDAKTAYQAAVKIMAGRELGFTVVQSMTGVHIIEGKPSMSANLIAAALRRSEKYDYRVVEHDYDGCVIEILMNGQPVGQSSFSMEDAKEAGLERKDNWVHYPRNMLFARAISNAVAWHAADLFQTRLYTPEELNPDLELSADGDIIDVSALALPEPEAPRSPQRAEREPRRRREKEPLPDVIATLPHLIRYAFENAEMQPEQLAEFLGEKTIGGIAAAVQGKFDGDYDAAARAIDNRETPDQESPEPAPDSETETADFVCITCGEVTTDRTYEPVCPDCHERENGSDESA